MAYHYQMPAHTIFGEDALIASQSALRNLGKRALIVAGKNVAKTGAVKALTDVLLTSSIDCEVFDGITGEPTDDMILAGVTAFKAANCDFLIGLGGGSQLDSVKAIAAMTVLPGQIADYMGQEITGQFPAMVLIPTTAGTGSEATKFTIVTDTAKGVKMLLKGDVLVPDLAIIDPSFALTAPPDVTAATGMDALTHAVEAYTSRKANAMTDLYALSAIKRIFTWLPTAYQDGSNLKAREEMAMAAYQAGVCINNASVTLVHGMSRPIGALFHVSHGLSNAMLIEACLTFAMDGCYDRFATMSRAIGAVPVSETDDKKAGEAFIRQLKQLCQTLNIPTLKAYGICQSEFSSQIEKMAQDAINSGSPANTIKNIQLNDLKVIYQSLW